MRRVERSTPVLRTCRWGTSEQGGQVTVRRCGGGARTRVLAEGRTGGYVCVLAGRAGCTCARWRCAPVITATWKSARARAPEPGPCLAAGPGGCSRGAEPSVSPRRSWGARTGASAGEKRRTAWSYSVSPSGGVLVTSEPGGTVLLSIAVNCCLGHLPALGRRLHKSALFPGIWARCWCVTFSGHCQ